jgi:IrrE N-terminal-like domain
VSKFLRPGFTKEAEATAEELRAELRVGNLRPLDPFELLRYLQIPAIPLAALPGLADAGPDLEAAISLLHSDERSELSAMTVFNGSARMIVYNDRHSPARRASDLCHEAAHGLLLHEPANAFDSLGCRVWDDANEAEADYLAGALLVPGKGARYAAKSGMTPEEAAERFGCSIPMINWRLNESGARRLMTVR